MTPMLNVAFVPDRFGNDRSALYLNIGYCQLPPGYYFHSKFTITAWVNPQDLNFSNQRILDFGNGPYINNLGLAYYSTTAGSYGFISDGNTENVIFAGSSIPLSLQQWSHLALVYDGASFYLYMNGIQSSSKAYATDPFLFRNNCFIGRSNWYPGNPDANVYLDDLKIYNRALTSQEILADMN
jgi:hypothetical protein